MKRMISTFVSIILLAGAAISAKEVQKGQYELYLNGLKKGYEKFKVIQKKKGGEETISSEMRFEIPVTKSKRGYIELHLYPEITFESKSGEFLGYEYRLLFNDFTGMEMSEAQQTAAEYLDQDKRIIDPMNPSSQAARDELEDKIDLGVNAGALERLGNTLHFKQMKYSSSRVKDEAYPQDLVVIDAYSFCLYIPIARRAMSMKGQSEAFTIALPQMMKLKKGRMEFMGAEKTPFRGKSFILKHYEVYLEEAMIASFWVDKAGTVVQISVPSEGVLAMITKYDVVSFEEEVHRAISETIVASSGFDEREVSIPVSGGVTVKGNLTLPRDGSNHKALLILQDMTPADRDGNTEEETLRRSSPVKQAAFCLAEKGIASLRFDSRGVAFSGGTREENRLETLTSDAAAILDWLKKQPGIQSDGVSVLGFGLGGWVGAMAAKKSPIASFVAVGFPAKELLRLWKEQAGVIIDPAQRQEAYKELDELKELLGTSQEYGTYRGRKVKLEELRELNGVKPLDILSSLSVPCLFAYPEKDQVVMAYHGEIVKDSLKKAQETMILEGTGHFLLGTEEDGSPKSLIQVKACEALAAWLNKDREQAPQK